MNVLEKLFNTFLATAVLVGLVFLTLRIGPTIENRIYPVVSEVSLFYTAAERDQNNLVISGYVTVSRACEMRKLAAYLSEYQDDTNKYDLVKLSILNKTEIKSRSEPGQHRWTLLIRVPKNYVVKDNFLILQTTHRCHRWWDLETEVLREPVLDVMAQR